MRDPVHVAPGYALPSEITAHTELADGTLVEIEVAVTGERAWARSVCASTENPRGVGWTTLSRVPIRNIAATAVLTALHKLTPTDDGRVSFMQVGADDAENADDIRQIVQAAVGYAPDTSKFKGVPS